MSINATPYNSIGHHLEAYQKSLASRGSRLTDVVEGHYLAKWRSEALFHVMRIRTALVSGMQDQLIREGMLNLERLSMSPVTDPLAHDVERLAAIPYRGCPYVATHSMIYAKFLACHNPHLKGIFVDSSNIRLELPAPDGRQRGRYLLDFSQLDVERKRTRGVDLRTYLTCPDEVAELLREDHHEALSFFEAMVRSGLERVLSLCPDSLEALGVSLTLPRQPFPVFHLDEALSRYSPSEVEAKLGAETDSQCFWIVGLLRENYDLVYPYLRPDGTRRDPKTATSREIYNYDLCVKGSGTAPAIEVLSGGLREWLPEAIVARLLDNGIIHDTPRFEGGELVNVAAMGGYGPFLTVACHRDEADLPTFPATFGAGIGIERLLWALLRGPQVRHIEDVTFFGKNPDTAEVFLF